MNSREAAVTAGTPESLRANARASNPLNSVDTERNQQLALWEAFSSPLRAFVRRRVPDSIDVDDVVQDIFLRIVRNLPALSLVERLDAWVFQVARTAVADALRAHRRRDARTDAVEVDTLEEPGDDEAESASRELTPCMAPFVSRLDEPYRTALELTALHGLTQQEAAEREGISLSGMKSRVQRARAQVRQQMLRCCDVQLDVRGGVLDYAVRDQSVCGSAPASITQIQRLQG